MLFLRALLCVLLLVASAATAAQTPAIRPAHGKAIPTSTSPNVILITIDTARADRMGFLGSARGLTPNLDALARQSVAFTHAYSQVPLTTASHAVILTGTYPQFNQVNDFGVALAPELPYAPDILRARGYHTAAFVGSLILDPQARSAPGFERGFDTYDSGFHRRRPGEDRYQSIERRGTEVVSHALAWLTLHPKAPFFLWIHLYDPHDPYDPPEPYKTRYASAPYDGEIAYTDFAVGKLLSQLRIRGLYQGSLIAVMSDHGEALGDHGELTHGIFLYDETIHVPLLFKLPAGRSAGKRIESRARLVDVLPTILETAGIPVPSAVQGESLLSLITASSGSLSASSTRSPATVAGPDDSSKIVTPADTRPAPDRPAYSESDYPHRTFGWSSLHSLRTGKYLFVEAPHPELYDQTSDPKAEHNLASSSSAVTNTLSSQLTAFRQQTATSKEAPKVVTDPELQEKLAALGYVASDTTSAPMPGVKETLADPKDRIDVVNLMHRAEMLAKVFTIRTQSLSFNKSSSRSPASPSPTSSSAPLIPFLATTTRQCPFCVKPSRCALI